jgi:hypothetical protein
MPTGSLSGMRNLRAQQQYRLCRKWTRPDEKKVRPRADLMQKVGVKKSCHWPACLPACFCCGLAATGTPRVELCNIRANGMLRLASRQRSVQSWFAGGTRTVHSPSRLDSRVAAMRMHENCVGWTRLRAHALYHTDIDYAARRNKITCTAYLRYFSLNSCITGCSELENVSFSLLCFTICVLRLRQSLARFVFSNGYVKH